MTYVSTVLARGVKRTALVLVLASTLAVAAASGASASGTQPGDEGSSSSRPSSLDEAVRDGRVSKSDAEQIRRDLTESMNEMATEDFGPMTSERAARTGQSTYYTESDLQFFMNQSKNDRTGATSTVVEAVPLHATINSDGTVTYPSIEDSHAIAADTWGGPWGGEYIDAGTSTSINDGGYFCTTTKGENRRRSYVRRLSDSSSTYDYVGLNLTGVAEITQWSSCPDWIDSAGVRMKSGNSSAIYVSQSPLADRTGSCVTTTLKVGGTYGGVTAEVSQPIQQCDYWDTVCGNCNSATNLYGVLFDGSKNSLDSQELAAIAVMRLPQGTDSGRSYSTTLHVANG